MVDTEKLGSLKDTESGPIFVLGSGPSLNAVPDVLLEKLKSHATIACNRFNSWEKAWTTDWYTCSSNMVVMGVEPKNPSVTKGRFLCGYESSQWPNDDRWIPVRKAKHHNPPKAMRTGASSAFLMVEIAQFLGYGPVYLLGCDMRDGPHVYGTKRPFLAAPWEQVVELWGQLDGVIDCTEGGRLNEEGVLPYQRLEEVLGE